MNAQPDLTGAVVQPAAPLSATRRMTRLKQQLLACGLHPLSRTSRPLPLHPDAAPPDDRTAPGLRCGTCVHRIVNHRGYPKCGAADGARATRGARTDVRAWWPACVDHQERP